MTLALPLKILKDICPCVNLQKLVKKQYFPVLDCISYNGKYSALDKESSNNWTVTGSPFLTLVSFSFKTIKALAKTIDFKIPDPCSPVIAAMYWFFSFLTMARMKCLTPFFF